ncbi:MAG: hypothetical protein AAFX52_01285 [Pseudomonadota bacterium]
MTELSTTKNDPRAAAKRKAKTMIYWTVGVLVALVLLFVIFSQSLFLEFRLSVLLKLGAGVLGTILLSAGLMAAAFYSDASGHDDDAPIG